MLFLLGLGLFPLIYSFGLMFTSFQMGSPISFGGLQNFYTLVADSRFWITLVNTGIIVTGEIILEFTLGLGIALMLNREFRGRRFFRGVFLAPMMLCPTGVALINMMLLHPYRGPLNYLLGLVGLPSAIDWRADPSIALYTIIGIQVWQWTPFMMAVLLAGLQAIPIEPSEAAMIDGASRWRILRHITLPLLSPVIIPALLIRAIDSFKVFDVIYVLTGGGPGITTESSTLYTYVVALRYFNLGYASAIAYFQVLVVGIVATFFISRIRRKG